MKKNHKRISAAVLSLALGFSVAGAPALAPMASAQTINADDVSTVNLDADVSLTIEKYRGLPIEDPATQLNPIAGVDFLIQKVDGIDLSTSEGWEDVADLIDGTATPTFESTFGDVTLQTDANGKASITTTAATGPVDAIENSAFTVGVYLVTEQPLAGHTVAEPFFVTLPFTDPSAGIWEYNRTVQPKNQQDINIEKDVEDLGVTLGEEITYTISAPLPAGNLTELEIADALPVELTHAFNVLVFTKVDAATDRAAFDLIDSTIVTNGGTEGNELTVTFNETDRAALQALRAANPDLEIIVEFQTTVESLPDEGVIENHASIDFGGALVYSTAPNDGTETRLGQLTINKRDDQNALITADSASFELWRCQLIDGQYTVLDEKISAATDADDVNTVDDTFVTVDGQAILYGVQIMDWVNNDTPDETIGEDLCVVETEAPESYVLNPEPQPVGYDLTTTDDDFDMVVDVINLDDTIAGQLPSTGGMGTMAMIAAGLLVAVAGGFAALRGNRARG